MQLIFALVSILFLKSVISIKTNDFCKNIDTNCTGSYDSKYNYKTHCTNFKCQGKHAYQCGLNKCSIDKQSCGLYNKILMMIKQFERSALFGNKLSSFDAFNSKILKCVSMSKYTLKASDICKSGINCFEKQKFLKRYGRTESIKKIDCFCRGKYNYHCGKDFCSVDSKACHTFNLILKKSNVSTETFNEIKQCGNGNLTIFTKIRIF